MVQSCNEEGNGARSPDDFLGFTVVRLAHVLQRRMDRTLHDELGISVRQFGALNYLATDPGIGSAALARKLLITPQSAGPLLDDLARRGYLERSNDAPSGTRKAAHVTADGLDLLRCGYAVADRLRIADEAGLTQADAAFINAALLRLLDRIVSLDDPSAGTGSS